MLEFTMRQVLEGDLDIPDEYYLYVVQDGETVFYVGMSTDPPDYRVYAHVYGGHRSGPSHLGQVIRANMPKSLGWQVQFFEPQEVIENLPTGWPNISMKHRAQLGEKALIRRLRPCLNVIYNQGGRQLPDCYKDPLRTGRLDNPAEDLISYEAE